MLQLDPIALSVLVQEKRLHKLASERYPTLQEITSFNPGGPDNAFDASVQYARFRKKLDRGMGAVENYGAEPAKAIARVAGTETSPWVAGAVGAGVALGGVGLAALLASRYSKYKYDMNRPSV